MTHQPYDEQRDTLGLTAIIAADEANPTLVRQVLNGLSGLVVLMVTGIVIVALVLWKSP